MEYQDVYVHEKIMMIQQLWHQQIKTDYIHTYNNIYT